MWWESTGWSECRGHLFDNVACRFENTLNKVLVRSWSNNWSKLVKIGRHLSKDILGQSYSDDQYPKGALLVN